jgi:hypothetical protein
MASFGLSLKCKAIAATVGLWLSRQGKLTRAIHASTVFQIQNSGPELELGVVLQTLNCNHPVLMGRYSARQVVSRTEAFLESEFSELSPVFSELFAEANQLYFQGSLPKYRVSVMHSLPPFIRTKAEPHEEEINYHLNQLNLHYNGWPDNMIDWLLHFMTHIKTGEHPHGRRWKNEMLRLLELGAPVHLPGKGEIRDRNEELAGPFHVCLSGTTPLSIE